ncbi:hypothetical protein NZL82_13915 [Sphingomonas sanguinis]|uniref:hypothetical protein n=1 Tax=Sphingomonas sp. LC-1 TaxID=3110957 RepID=UPI0021BB63EB|nr:hypothetical protein [Sphingomonas sp. LC-1]MCT8002972.1 hypothetical protein [Sphingomonas sp. LC-1]
MKPEGYPLPWCDEVDAPYWHLNLLFCSNRDWARWQRDRSVGEVIPVLRWVLNLPAPGVSHGA